jgi:hypothetical protein
MKKTLKKTQAASIIEEHFRSLNRGLAKVDSTGRSADDVFVSARAAGRRMVEIYRLLTGEMPQAAGIEIEYRGDELPGVEFASPIERDPNEIFHVNVSVHLGDPDILISGDHDGESYVNKQLEEKEGFEFRRLPRGKP